MDDTDNKPTNETIIPGVAYVAPSEDGAELSDMALSNIPVGLQEHATQMQAQSAQDTAKTVSKYRGKSHEIAWDAQKKRVSRRLLLATRAKKLTVVCEDTGIVSLLEIPAIPGYALSYYHPLAELDNARGLVQRGKDYLYQLDTQTLAGIMLVLANSYSLFKFDPNPHQQQTSGAQRNALLRSIGKDLLIDAVLLIEEGIHSKNVEYLPKLSLISDLKEEKIGIALRIKGYLTQLADAVAAPDTSVYDADVRPTKTIRPIYTRDVTKRAKSQATAQRRNASEARKDLADDAREAKLLASRLVANDLAKPGLKTLVNQLMANNGAGLLAANSALIDMVVAQKLALINHEDAGRLAQILTKDRSILKLGSLDEPEVVAEEPVSFFQPLPPTPAKTSAPSAEPIPPAALSSIEKILWLKKWRKSNGMA